MSVNACGASECIMRHIDCFSQGKVFCALYQFISGFVRSVNPISTWSDFPFHTSSSQDALEPCSSNVMIMDKTKSISWLDRSRIIDTQNKIFSSRIRLSFAAAKTDKTPRGIHSYIKPKQSSWAWAARTSNRGKVWSSWHISALKTNRSPCYVLY